MSAKRPTRQELAKAYVWLCAQVSLDPSDRARAQADSTTDEYDVGDELRFLFDSADLDSIGNAMVASGPDATIIRQWLDVHGEVLQSMGNRAKAGIIEDAASIAPMVERILDLTGYQVERLDELTKSLCWIMANIIQGTEHGPAHITAYLNSYAAIIGEARAAAGVPSPSPTNPFVCMHPKQIHENIDTGPKKLVTPQ